MRTSFQSLASVAAILILGACSSQRHTALAPSNQVCPSAAWSGPLPELHGHFSHQDVVDMLTSIPQTERVLRIEEDDFGEINAYAGNEAGVIVYLFRREKGRLVGCGAGYWSGSPGKSNWPLSPGLGYDLDKSN